MIGRPTTMVIELVGGPRCGETETTPIGPQTVPPPAVDGYARTARLITTARGGVRIAYEWVRPAGGRREAPYCWCPLAGCPSGGRERPT